MRKLVLLLAGLILGIQAFASSPDVKTTKTAEDVFAFAASMETFDKDLLKAEMNDLSKFERARLIDMAIADCKFAQAQGLKTPPVGLYVLAVVFPPLAVGIYTDWGIETLYNVLWCCLFGFPGIIHAFIVLSR